MVIGSLSLGRWGFFLGVVDEGVVGGWGDRAVAVEKTANGGRVSAGDPCRSFVAVIGCRSLSIILAVIRAIVLDRLMAACWVSFFNALRCK